MFDAQKTARIARSFAWVIVGIWVYCLAVAPLFSGEDYASVALEKAKSIGIGFTIATLVVGTIVVLVSRRSSQK